MAKILQTTADLEHDIAQLIKIEPKFGEIRKLASNINWPHKLTGFAALFRTIVAQQLSNQAAASIYARLLAAQLDKPANINKASDAQLRSTGLSWQKIKYLRALLAAEIDYPQLENYSDAQVIAELTKVTGIGSWTAKMYLLESLKRADVIPLSDLAIQKAIIHLMAIDANSNAKVLQSISDNWQPYRSVASLLLWQYYAYLKSSKTC